MQFLYADDTPLSGRKWQRFTREYAPDRVVRDTRKRSDSLIFWSNKIYQNPFETLARLLEIVRSIRSINRWTTILRSLFSTCLIFSNFSRLKSSGGSVARVIVFVIGNIWIATRARILCIREGSGVAKIYAQCVQYIQKYLQNKNVKYPTKSI